MSLNSVYESLPSQISFFIYLSWNNFLLWRLTNDFVCPSFLLHISSKYSSRKVALQSLVYIWLRYISMNMGFCAHRQTQSTLMLWFQDAFLKRGFLKLCCWGIPLLCKPQIKEALCPGILEHIVCVVIYMFLNIYDKQKKVFYVDTLWLYVFTEYYFLYV